MEIRTSCTHVYFSSFPDENITCQDWSMLTDSWYYQMNDTFCLMNGGAYQRILSCKNNSTTVPTGSSIYVAPRSKYNIADIRKNYNIKRAPDTGDYNVFTERMFEVWRCYDIRTLIILPDRSLFLSTERHLETEAEQLKFCKDMLGSFDASEPFQVLFDEQFYAMHRSELVATFLDGGFEKPVVMENALDLSTGNDVTPDILDILYNAGKQENSSEARQNYITVLNMLNQHNWRDCPGTICMIFNRYRSRYCVHDYVHRKISQWPKPIQEIMRTCTKASYKGEKDRRLAQEYIERLLNIGQQRFATQHDLDEQLRNHDIGWSDFLDLYDCVVRIRPKNFTE